MGGAFVVLARRLGFDGSTFRDDSSGAGISIVLIFKGGMIDDGEILAGHGLTTVGLKYFLLLEVCVWTTASNWRHFW